MIGLVVWQFWRQKFDWEEINVLFAVHITQETKKCKTADTVGTEDKYAFQLSDEDAEYSQPRITSSRSHAQSR